MSDHTFELIDGLITSDLKGGEETTHKTVVMRSLTAGDLIDAEEASEQLVKTPEGYEMVSSPGAMGRELLCRQIVSIGEIKGPLRMSELRKLTANDLAFMQNEAEKLDLINFKKVIQEGQARGRDEGDGAADGKGGGNS